MKCFLRGAQIFELYPPVLNYTQQIFLEGKKNILGRYLRPHGYGPVIQHG